MERFFVKTTPEVKKALLHLAIDLDSGAEKLAGKLLEVALEMAKSGKIKPTDLK